MGILFLVLLSFNMVFFLSIFFVALALAADAFSMAIMAGAGIAKVTLKHALIIAVYFGVLQGLMTFLGWAGGILLQDVIASFDHWVAFCLLSFVGGKMIYESFSREETEKFSFEHSVILMLAIATSIDAFVVGMSYALLQVAVTFPIILITLVTAILSFLGVYIGKYLKHVIGKQIGIFGGVILILLGFGILVDHGVFL